MPKPKKIGLADNEILVFNLLLQNQLRMASE